MTCELRVVARINAPHFGQAELSSGPLERPCQTTRTLIGFEHAGHRFTNMASRPDRPGSFDLTSASGLRGDPSGELADGALGGASEGGGAAGGVGGRGGFGDLKAASGDARVASDKRGAHL